MASCGSTCVLPARPRAPDRREMWPRCSEKPPSQIESIASLGTRIEEWRQAKTRRAEPMPQALWDGAVALADVHGVYATSRELRLNYDHLKKRLESGGSIESSPAEPSSKSAFLAKVALWSSCSDVAALGCVSMSLVPGRRRSGVTSCDATDATNADPGRDRARRLSQGDQWIVWTLPSHACQRSILRCGLRISKSERDLHQDTRLK